MKVTDPDVIKAGEKDLIESIKDDLDWNVIKEVFLQKIKSSSFDIKDDSLSFAVSGGEIVVHEGAIAFRVDFQLRTETAIMFDRNGNYIPGRDHSDSGNNIQSKQPEYDEIDILESDSINGLKSDMLKEDENLKEMEYEDYYKKPVEYNQIDQIVDDGELLDGIASMEADDILRDLADKQDAQEIDSIANLNAMNHSDDIKNILKESRDFWGKQEK